jgi:hypothetical protein
VKVGQGYCVQNSTPQDVGGFEKFAILAYNRQWLVKLAASRINFSAARTVHNILVAMEPVEKR